MAPAPPKSIPDILRDLWELLRAYAKQETIDPITNLKTVLKYGVPGGFLVALGGFFLALGALRGLQRLSYFQDFWSFAPYLIVSLLLCGWAYLLLRLIKKEEQRPDLTRPHLVDISEGTDR